MSASKLRSDVWEHFIKHERTAKCKHCAKEFSFCGGTSNLRDHLLRAHERIYQPNKDSEAKTNKGKIEAFVTKTTCSVTRENKITQLIADFVAQDTRPAAVVEGAGFKRLLNYLEPGYRVPSAVHVVTCLQKRYSQVKSIVQRKLEEVNYISLTSDIWTSLSTQSYISSTAHFITDNWELHSCVLQTLYFPESHTGELIADKLKEICVHFSLPLEKVVAVVHDLGSNMRASLRILNGESDWASVECAAHTLQLCVKEGLEIPNIANLLSASRKLVGHFRHSSKATAALDQRQRQMNMPGKRLVQDCPTRWNSSFYMLERLLELRWPVSAVISDENVTKKSDRALDLKSTQWSLAEDLLPSLQKIQTATAYFSEEENVSLSTVLPVVLGLAENLHVDTDDSLSVQDFKRTVKAAILRRWNTDQLSPLLFLATALDPRFKLIKQLDDSLKKNVTEMVISNVERVVGDVDCTMADLDVTIVDSVSSSQSSSSQDLPVTKKAKPSALDILLGPEEDIRGRSIDDEVDAYFHEKVCLRKTNILEWWKINEPRFPNLSQLAKAIIGIPATSTPSERLFSVAGNVVSKKRTCLNPENVDIILFLNKNLKFLQ